MNVLIVEDTPAVTDTIELCISMRWPGSKIMAVDQGKQAPHLVENESPDIVILDLALPDVDGLDVLKDIRSFSDVPVLIVSARGDEVSRVRGLEIGADDYVTKPFSHTELLARINAVVRRSERSYDFDSTDVIGNDKLLVDFSLRRVFVQGKPVDLSATEWDFIAFAARNKGKILSPARLAEQVWGSEFVDPAAIKMCVYRLRRKLGDNPRRPSIIRTHRGMGYSLQVPFG